MPALKGTKTHENLLEAFAGESQANRRYIWFAQKADIEGYPDAAALFRSVAEGETGHAHGHLEYIAEVGDPASGEPIGETKQTSKHQLLARPMSTHRCTQDSQRQLAKKDSMKLLTGSKLLLAQRRATLVVSQKALQPSNFSAAHWSR